MGKIKLFGMKNAELRKIIRKLELELRKMKKIVLKPENNFYTRNEVLRRDNQKCRLCGDEDIILDVHHLTPKSIGGSDNVRNVITVCKSCHHFMHANPMIVMKQKFLYNKQVKIESIGTLSRKGIAGRPIGSKDKKPRDNRKYLERWQREKKDDVLW